VLKSCEVSTRLSLSSLSLIQALDDGSRQDNGKRLLTW